MTLVQPSSFITWRAPRPGSCPWGRCARRCADRSGSTCPARPASAPGSSEVRPTAVLAGLICGDPASLRIGIETRRGARVELADVHRGRVVLRRLARVRGRRLGRPGAGLRGRVVERLVLDRDVTGLAAGLLERQLDPLDHVGRLRSLGALQRQGGVDRDGLGLAVAPARTARLVVVPASHRDQRDRQHRQARSHHRISFRLRGDPRNGAGERCAEVLTSVMRMA